MDLRFILMIAIKKLKCMQRIVIQKDMLPHVLTWDVSNVRLKKVKICPHLVASMNSFV
jgi:hypothetical protein